MARAKRICAKTGCPQPATGRYCTEHNREYEANRGNSNARGYGSAHQALRRAFIPEILAGTMNCWRCGEPIKPDEAWDLGHADDDRTRYMGPEHANRCNRAAAGRKAHQQPTEQAPLDPCRVPPRHANPQTAGEGSRKSGGFRHLRVQPLEGIMTRGGSRNRSGPQKDPGSLTSAAQGVVFHALPADGYQGAVPVFPLPDETGRESEVWGQLWRTPQAAAWSVEPWRWRVVAMYVRWSVRMEDAEANAALVSQVIRLGDQIGMTPAGLKENGWQIARAESEQKATGTAGKPRGSSRARLKVVGNDG